jgi:hypothetical protein
VGVGVMCGWPMRSWPFEWGALIPAGAHDCAACVCGPSESKDETEDDSTPVPSPADTQVLSVRPVVPIPTQQMLARQGLGRRKAGTKKPPG